jgi:uncharacterized membrane protein YidH (DUF202 family)
MLKRALAALGAAAVMTAVAVGGAAAVRADTNSSNQKSTQLLCNVVLLSPNANVGGCSNVQVNNQNMVKTDTRNSSVIDYAGVDAVTGLLP